MKVSQYKLMPTKIIIPIEVMQRMIASYKDGLSAQTIAKNEGYNYQKVLAALKESGQHIRTRSESSTVRVAAMGAKSHTGKHGIFHSKKSMRWISVDSSYEYARCIQLENDETVSCFKRSTDQIPYQHDGIIRRYNPDFEVTLKSGQVRVEEVKPRSFLDNEIVQAKAKSATERYSSIGVEYQIITEDILGEIADKHITQSGLGEIDEEKIKAIRTERRRQISRESARRIRAANPMTAEDKAKHAAQQLARYRRWKVTATPEQIEARRAYARESARRQRAQRAQSRNAD